MRRRLAIVAVSASFLGAATGAVVARPAHAATAKIPPACVQHKVGPFHVQVGYCP